jgi:hypothetical protein
MRKFKTCRQRALPFRSLLFAAGALLLTTAFLPQASAEFCPPGATCSLFTHFNFNGLPDDAPPPYTSNGPAITTLFNDPAQSFPSGQISIANGQGTTLNGGGDPAGGALDLRGNTSGLGTSYCFDIGPMNVSGLGQLSVSFALKSVGNGGQFRQFSLAWSTTGLPGSWTTFSTQAIIQDGVYHLYTAQLPLTGQTTIYIQFCFTGSTNDANPNNTYIDNIEIDSVIPEPATVAGGVLGVLGLCWHQRRRFARSLRLRRA